MKKRLEGDKVEAAGPVRTLLQWSRQEAVSDKSRWSVAVVMERKGNNLREI